MFQKLRGDTFNGSDQLKYELNLLLSLRIQFFIKPEEVVLVKYYFSDNKVN